MAQLNDEGLRIVNDLAIRHNFSLDAITHMLCAVQNGNASMAQFNHPEFAGGGQWMSGGMTMIGDMFNQQLKGRIELLCQDIADVISRYPGGLMPGSFQSQSQGSSSNSMHRSSPFFEPDPSLQWWPEELGTPASLGNQNNVGYAYFPNLQRLAVRTGDQVWVYDTMQHQIGGFSQQQGLDGSISFSSQFGVIHLGSLPVVFKNGQAVVPTDGVPHAANPVEAPSVDYQDPPNVEVQATAGTMAQPGSEIPLPSGESISTEQILDTIERLAELHERGILTPDEFAVKKEELLSRL